MPEAAAQTKHFLSGKVEHFTESVIREMTRQAMLHGAINLAQGFPDFAAPAEIKQAAQEAIAADVNQYAITWGAKSLRQAIARKFQQWQGLTIDPERELTVCCGSTEAMISTLLAVSNAGDEVVISSPFTRTTDLTRFSPAQNHASSNYIHRRLRTALGLSTRPSCARPSTITPRPSF
jgi:aminotransferase